MSDLNRVLLTGRVAKDPEVRYTPSGTAVADVRLAVHRTHGGAAGEKRKEETTFVSVTAWGRQAELCREYVKKGRRLLVEGRLVEDSWQSPQGEKRTRMKVVAENLQFLDAPPSADAPPADPGPAAGGIGDDLDLGVPF